MDIYDAIYNRKSIRGFKPDPVPKEVIKDVLQAGVQAPSAMNTQPWELTVVTGDTLEKIKEENLKNLAATEEFFDYKYEGIYRERQVKLAKQLFQLMGISRDDKEKRNEWLKRGFRFFDAPVAIIISMDMSMEGSWAVFDIGCLAQTICLAALKHELGTCIEVQGVTYEKVIKKYTGLPGSQNVIMGIALGYPDWEFPANKVESTREDVDNITRWMGF